MSYDRYDERNDCGACCCMMLLFIIYILLTTMHHVDIDEHNLDLWDREHGLDPCCIRDEHGIIRNRETNKVEWKRIVKDKNPFWSDLDWDDWKWEDEVNM